MADALEEAHTPGPWVPSMGGFQVLTGDSWNTVCVLHEGNGERWRDHRLAGWEDRRCATHLTANARLIAAAPELLAALKALMPEGWADDDTMDHVPGVKLARLAIAKATGTESGADPDAVQQSGGMTP